MKFSTKQYVPCVLLGVTNSSTQNHIVHIALLSKFIVFLCLIVVDLSHLKLDNTRGKREMWIGTPTSATNTNGAQVKYFVLNRLSHV